MVTWQIDAMALEESEPALRPLDAQLEAMRVRDNLDVEDLWQSEDIPPEYRKMLNRYDEAQDEFFAATLERHGEHAIAALFRTDRAQYERRHDAGRLFFVERRVPDDPDNPAWLALLRDAVDEAVEPEGPMGPLVVRSCVEDHFWIVEIYPTPLELVGGPDDGAVISPLFSLDLEELRG